MKPLILGTFLFFSTSMMSQDAIPDVLVVFGTDCSMTTLITNHSYNTRTIVKNDIPQLNRDVIRDCIKLKKNFKTKELIIDTAVVSKRNAQRPEEGLLVDKKFMFNNAKSTIKTLLENYPTDSYKDKQGEGMLFVMEEINERDDEESFYIVLFDLKTRNIIHCDKVVRSLSKIKNAIGSGYVSWRTGICRTVAVIDDVYDFWETYPENEKIDL